jgi:ADP-ribosylglycohydrolase
MPTSSSPDQKRLSRIRTSALWAACGDALGFITELADARGVARRGVALPVKEPVPWRRRVGGRFGPTVELAAGSVSDDTQLRLATSRSIRGDGVFDAETFSKVELTVWPSYALGAGLGSREAAANLRRRDVTWATNFFEGKRSTYVDGGGNGAAMRVQPHVWAAGAGSGWRTDVIVNSICTHGHMRGVLGALFHATCLHRALKTTEVPGPDDWDDAALSLADASELIRSHDLLDHLWLGLWEKQSRNSLEDAIATVIGELREDLNALRRIGKGAGGYEDAVETLSAYRPEQRGSGIKTSVLAAVAAWLFAGEPAAALATCANRLGTDTDSIATMAGALAGAATEDEPDMALVERSYIVREAERLWAIGAGRSVPSFPYPSIMNWTPPRYQVDCVGSIDGGLAVAGLGPLRQSEENPAGSENSANEWVCGDLWFGQRVLVKRRPRPKPLPQSQVVNPTDHYLTASLLDAPVRQGRSSAGPRRSSSREASEKTRNGSQHPQLGQPNLHELTDEIIAGGFNAEAVGQALIHLAERDNGIELSGQYATILAKALLSRRDRGRHR